MANTKKITKREVLNELLKEDLIQDTPMYKTYIVHELELLDKKNASAKGKDKTKENQEIESMIIETLKAITTEEKSQFTVTEIMKASEEMQNYVCESTGKALSNSKLTYVIRDMLSKENPQIANVKSGKSSLYSLI